MVYKWIENVRALLLPSICSVCGSDTQATLDLCPDCRAELPFNTHACARCAAPLEDTRAPICGTCLARHWYFDHTTAPLLYRPPVSGLITALKFRRRLAAARLLGELLCENILAAQRPLPQVLIPVPLHPSRLRRRGYNQALEIGRLLSRRLDLPLQWQTCHRLRPTAAQSGMLARERRRNVRNAFACNAKDCWEHVAIIDDVLTTGHTVNEMARVLRKAGASRIDVWCVARTPPHG